jgi:hypothetical protein
MTLRDLLQEEGIDFDTPILLYTGEGEELYEMEELILHRLDEEGTIILKSEFLEELE